MKSMRLFFVLMLPIFIALNTGCAEHMAKTGNMPKTVHFDDGTFR